MAGPGGIKAALLAGVIITLLTLAIIWADHAGNTDNHEEIIVSDDTIETAEATVRFLVGDNITFKCEVADTDAERATGLMNRNSLSQDCGMLFIFESPQNVTFWMKDTLIPLDIIFIGTDGIVVNIEEANPEPDVSNYLLTRYGSDGPVKWVLEINQGLSEAYGIIPGTEVIILLN